MKKAVKLAFLVIAAATILEYLFVCGQFTGPLMMALSCIAGILNLALSAKDKRYNEAALYLVASLALCMGYWSLMR